jgi:hypothetical protein
MSAPATPLSLNEICFYFTRAATGAGAPFGIGEDFAAAAVWLSGQGADPAVLAAAALAGLTEGISGMRPCEAGDACWQSDDRPALSAIHAGPAAADWLTVEAAQSGRGRLVLRRIDQPALIAAAIAAAGVAAERIAVLWSSAIGERRGVVLAGGSVSLVQGEEWRAPSPQPADVELVLNGPDLPVRTGTARAAAVAGEPVAVGDAPWAIIHACFCKSLVPSTNQSRKAGAGAGLTDND